MDHATFLDVCLDEAELARRDGAMPVGAVIVALDGSILSQGRNRVLSHGDQTAHAEVDAIRNAGTAIVDKIPEGGWVLYSSAEPCLMCLGAIILTPVKTIVWANDSVTGSAFGTLLSGDKLASGPIGTKSPLEIERIRTLTVIREPSSVHRSRSRDLLREFFTIQGNLARAQLY